MKKFLLGFGIGILFAGLVLVILAFAAVRMASSLGGERPVTVSDNPYRLMMRTPNVSSKSRHSRVSSWAAHETT